MPPLFKELQPSDWISIENLIKYAMDHTLSRREHRKIKDLMERYQASPLCEIWRPFPDQESEPAIVEVNHEPK